MEKPVLVLGVGNILLADEGVGVHVVRQLQEMPLPAGVEVLDGGTGGFELIEHLRGRKKVIIIDAVQADAPPGTVLRFHPEDAALQWRPPFSAHQTGLHELLHFCRQLVPPPEVSILGVVPQETQRASTQLSPMIQDRVPAIIAAVINEAERTP